MLYTFYGDDFTGSTDVLEQLALKAVRAVLFLGIPTEAHLARFAGVEAMGIAGDSRSRSPEWMDEHLPGIFEFLKSRRASVNHYKVCSTFDSSPERGNIGRAMEIGGRVFGSSCVPVIIAAPHLRRYIAFGNLFAGDADGEVKRVDRHSMAHHPATPMREADLRRHLAKQTILKTALMDLPSLRSADAATQLGALVEDGAQSVLFDGTDEEDVRRTGELLRSMAESAPLFVVGSSGVTSALLSSRMPARDPVCATVDGGIKRKPLLVVSGSCSVATMAQIKYAEAHGFHGFPLDAATLVDPADERERVARQASATLAEGVSTVLYTALGPHVAASTSSVPSNDLGSSLGVLLKRIVEQTGQRRVVLCGGDTSSHAVQQLGCYALTALRTTQTGAPLCRLHTDDSALDGLEIVLKGGQVGSRDFFEFVRDL
jgi:uncharacterized protein YgbK (DUF1537 family)